MARQGLGRKLLYPGCKAGRQFTEWGLCFQLGQSSASQTVIAALGGQRFHWLQFFANVCLT